MKTSPLLLVLGLVAAGAALPVSPVRGDGGAAVSQSYRFTSEALGALGGSIASTEKGVLVLEVDLPPEDGQQAAPAAPRPAPARPAEIAQVKSGIAQVKEMARQAQQELEDSKAASDPQVAQAMIKDAQQKAEAARNYLNYVSTLLPPAASARQPEGSARVVRHAPSGGTALRQLMEANALAQSGSSTGAVFDGSAPEIAYDPVKYQLRLRNGQVVDVRPLSTVFRGKAPLFTQVSVPGKAKPVEVLSPGAREALATPQARKVGGVDLQVILDLLGFLGVADFRHQGPAAHIEEPVLVSLAGLVARSRPYAADWGRLPEELRYPGSIERIHGYVLDPARRDVFLVGSRARTPQRRIDIDSVILALQTVWLKGVTPAVSLDPLPDNPGGPQYARVLEVPQDSVFAKIMLEADYAMKRIALGALPVRQPGYQSLAQLMEKEQQDGIASKPFGSRMWLYPVPLGRGNIHLSATGRSVLFETRVMVLTEQGHISTSGFVGAGSTDEKAELVAKSFTKAYGEFEESREIEPAGTYLRLHGLVDLVTSCKLLREAAIDYPVLHDLSALPVRQLAGAEAVPAYYPGINVWAAGGTISGGVLARPKLSSSMLDRYQDATTLNLEHAVDSFRPKQRFAQAISLDFTLPESGFESQWEVERLMDAGKQALSRYRYEEARDKFRGAVEADPLNADAWAFLGQTESLLGLHREAALSVGRALGLEPGDATFLMIALDLRLRAEPGLDISPYDEGIRRQLSHEYSERARAALSVKYPARARQEADWALKLWEDNTDAYFVRALTWQNGESQAVGDWIEAIRGYQRLMQGDHPEQWKRRLALALATRAALRVKGMGSDGGTAQQHLSELQRAADEAARSRALDESLPVGLVTEVMMRATRADLYEQMGMKPDLGYLRELADQAVRRFPDFSPAHDWRGMALSLAGEKDAALEEFGQALRLDPTSQVALLGRATLYVERQLCGDARADVARLRALRSEADPELDAILSRCRQ